MILGLDASTSIVGYAFVENNEIIDAGFLNISKLKTNKEKAKFVLNFLQKQPHKCEKINLSIVMFYLFTVQFQNKARPSKKFV